MGPRNLARNSERFQIVLEPKRIPDLSALLTDLEYLFPRRMWESKNYFVPQESGNRNYPVPVGENLGIKIICSRTTDGFKNNHANESARSQNRGGRVLKHPHHDPTCFRPNKRPKLGPKFFSLKSRGQLCATSAGC